MTTTRRIIETGMAICVASVVTRVAAADVLYLNGDTDGINGYSNATRNVFGFRRALLDDFVVPDNEVWTIDALRHLAVWNTLPPGAGTGMELSIWDDNDGVPGEPLFTLNVFAYEEEPTGHLRFNREEYAGFSQFDPVVLEAGRYWFEAASMGPENNFWLTAPQQNNGCWINYEDNCGIWRCPQEAFGGDIAWAIHGVSSPVPCAADIDDNGFIEFDDLLAVIAAWGPCAGCPEDIDGDDTVGFSDLVVLLASWGPCE